MDNAVTIPGYKCFVAPDGSRPDVCVAFLDIAEAPGAWVTGACIPVGPADLAALDARERNYVRVEVTGAVTPAAGRTWAYVGREDARRRCARAIAEGRCAVADEYLAAVEAGFRALGDAEWERFAASAGGERPPVRALRRVDL
jgi:hypothetical protein